MMDMMPNAIGVFINIVRKLPRISTKGKGKTYIMNRTSKKIDRVKERGYKGKPSAFSQQLPFLFGLFLKILSVIS